MPTVLLTAILKDAVGASKIQTSGTTALGAIQDVASRYPRLERLVLRDGTDVVAYVGCFVNGVRVAAAELHSVAVHDGDEIQLVPAVAGG